METLKHFFSLVIRALTFVLNLFKVRLVWPYISNFQPVTDYAGSIIEIYGKNFGNLREDNQVTIGGVGARVIEASAAKLKVLSSYNTLSGKIKITAGGRTVESPFDFNVKPLPLPDSTDDGPPVIIEGSEYPSPGPHPYSGEVKILAVLVHPTTMRDRRTNETITLSPTPGSRDQIVNAFKNFATFYDQASYGSMKVDVTVTGSWHVLSENFEDYVVLKEDEDDDKDKEHAPNIRPGVLDQLMAECAQHAQNDGYNLNNYQDICCVIFLKGEFIRAWGGSSTANFNYINPAKDINIKISTDHQLGRFYVCETSDWGRMAHELGHCIVDSPDFSGLSDFASAVLGEDVYGADFTDASAELFDMMGASDDHPIFSSYYLESLGWFNDSNILALNWNRNPFSETYQVVAHGLSQNTAANRYHMIKIKISDGLFYYVEVRQRPPTGSVQIFDGSIPLGSATHNGGVIVTKVFTGFINNNQPTRFITLLHEPNVLSIDQVAIDPARDLKITVVNDAVVGNPLVCSVRIEWAQTVADDPAGQFDLIINPWDSNCQSPDIWIHRNPFKSFDDVDAEGRPFGNGDKPRPHEINRFYARIHNEGEMPASDVSVTFYAVSPPGIGDNGNWSPLGTKSIAIIDNNKFFDIYHPWTPVVGEHTCLKVYIQPQFGEICVTNNSAQENVFDFEAPASSVPDAVYIPVAVRNPLKERTVVLISVCGVKCGYIAHFPHAWVWLDALEEKKFTFTVIPSVDYDQYMHLAKRFENPDYSTHINLTGYIPKRYNEKIGITGWPASKLENIGGIFATVKPKIRSALSIIQDKEPNSQLIVSVTGFLSAQIADQKIILDVTSPIFETICIPSKTDNNGRFNVIIDLQKQYKESVEKGIVNDEREFVETSKAMAQAFVFDANEVAETPSNIIQLNISS